jgi:hypothetical protein
MKQPANKEFRDPRAQYEIVPSIDYFNIMCVRCGDHCETHYKGLDPSIPRIELVCRCGRSGPMKLAKGWHFGNAR